MGKLPMVAAEKDLIIIAKIPKDDHLWKIMMSGILPTKLGATLTLVCLLIKTNIVQLNN